MLLSEAARQQPGFRIRFGAAAENPAEWSDGALAEWRNGAPESGCITPALHYTMTPLRTRPNARRKAGFAFDSTMLTWNDKGGEDPQDRGNNAEVRGLEARCARPLGCRRNCRDHESGPPLVSFPGCQRGGARGGGRPGVPERA